MRGVDRKYPEFGTSDADELVIADLRSQREVEKSFDRRFDEAFDRQIASLKR